MNKINNYNKEEHIQFIETLIKTEQVAVFINNMDISERSKVEQNDTLEYLYNRIIELQNNWNELKKALKEEIDICDGCIDTMTNDLQETTPIGNGKSYLTSEIFKNKVAKRSFEITLDKMQELEQVK